MMSAIEKIDTLSPLGTRILCNAMQGRVARAVLGWGFGIPFMRGDARVRCGKAAKKAL